MWVAPASRAQKAFATAKNRNENETNQFPAFERFRIKKKSKLTATRVIVEVTFDIARNDTTKSPDEFVNLTRVGATDGISDTDTVYTDLVDSTVDGEEVDEVGSERVFRGETNFDTLGLDEFDNFDSRLDNVSNVLSVRVLAEERRSSDNDIYTVDT